MFHIEVKKTMHYQKGALILLISLIAYTIFCIGSGYDSSYAVDRDEDIYLSYIERWQGKITEQTVNEMESEYYELNHSNDIKKTAFMVVYNQYFYAKEDVDHRYIMDQRGWNTLLTKDGLNFILMICLLAIITPIFCNEYQCKMDQILRSCENGRDKLAYIKLLTAAALGIGISAVFQLIQFSVIALMVGVDGSSFPLQSLSYFENSPYFITIGQAYLIVFLCRCIGGAWFALLLSFFSIATKSVVLTTFAGITVSVIPHLIGSRSLKYYLPLPTGMLAGTGYIWGTLTEVGYDDNWELIDVVTFHGIAPTQLCILIVAVFSIIALLFYVCLKCYVGGRKKKIPKQSLPLVVSLGLMLFVTGCSFNGSCVNDHDFLVHAMSGENSDYTIALDKIENHIYATEKKTGKDILLTNDPFDQKDAISSIFVDEYGCYYLTQGNLGEGFSIYRIDLRDFSTKLFFRSTHGNESTFWGLYQHNNDIDELLSDVGEITSFVVDGGDVYYLQQDRLYKVSIVTGRSSVVVANTQTAQTLLYTDGEIIYTEQTE